MITGRGSWDSKVVIDKVTGWTYRIIVVRFPGGQELSGPAVEHQDSYAVGTGNWIIKGKKVGMGNWLIIHLRLLPISRTRESTPPLHGVMLNWAHGLLCVDDGRDNIHVRKQWNSIIAVRLDWPAEHIQHGKTRILRDTVCKFHIIRQSDFFFLHYPQFR